MDLSKKEYYMYKNTLLSLIKHVEDQYIIVDLNDDSSVNGKLYFVDGYMNMDMVDVIYYDTRGRKYPFERFYIRNRNIRFVHLPKGLDVMQAVKTELSTNKFEKHREKEKKNIKRQHKQKSAKARHDETVRLMQK